MRLSRQSRVVRAFRAAVAMHRPEGELTVDDQRRRDEYAVP